MFKFVLIAVFLAFSTTSSAQHIELGDVKYKDWRLERPFIHGFLGVISLNNVDLFPTTWTVAEPNEPNALALGSVQILEQHKQIPFLLGMLFGLFSLSICLVGTYRIYKFRHVVNYFLREKEKYEAEIDS